MTDSKARIRNVAVLLQRRSDEETCRRVLEPVRPTMPPAIVGQEGSLWQAAAAARVLLDPLHAAFEPVTVIGARVYVIDPPVTASTSVGSRPTRCWRPTATARPIG